MANAVIGDVGDVMQFDTGQDLTGWTALKVFLTLPHGSVLTKTNTTNSVNTGASQSAGIIYYTTEADVCVEDGDILCTCYFELVSGASKFSQPTPNIYTVRRRNQTA